MNSVSSVVGLQFFITGASRGLGLGLVKRILELGGNVVATCRHPESARELNQLAGVYPEPILVILPLDVTNKEALEDIRGVIRRKGIDTIDVCIANAGVASKNHPYDPAWTCPEDDLLNTFQTNTMGTLFTAQSIAPLLSMSKKAKLFIGISSRMGSLSEAVGVGGYTSYRISKAGMNMACVCMAHDPSMMGIGIKFLILHPGWASTAMGSAGGRQCPLTVEESCVGMLNVIQRAIDVQMYSMGSSVYEERTWSKKTTQPPASVVATTEPSLALKCPYSGASLSTEVAPPIPPPAISQDPIPLPPAAEAATAPAESTSAGGKCPYQHKEKHSSSQIETTSTSKPAAEKCPFASTASGDEDRLSFGSLDDDEEGGGSCPFKVIEPEPPAVTENTFQLIAERFQNLTASLSVSVKDKDPEQQVPFEISFLQQRCVFVAFDGTMIPW